MPSAVLRYMERNTRPAVGIETEGPSWLLLDCVISHLRTVRIVIMIIMRISHFSALAGKYSPILGCIINRIRLGGLMCNLENFLQLNMCREFPLFAFVYMCLGAG
jgi:hypothetical protein